MAITALVENGKVVDTGSKTTSATSNQNNSNSAVDEEMFLNLLVAEMKYQDPLEPTSNTEWISQYATFTSIEQQTAMQQSIKQVEANNLVGQQVIMKTVNSITGETSYQSGIVDYVYVEEGEIYLSVNNNLYNIDDLDTVVNADYMDALTCSQTFEAMINKLPSEAQLTLADENLITAAREAYDSMTDYQKTFVSEDLLKTLTTLETKMNQLISTSKDAEETTEEATETDDSVETDETVEGEETEE